MCFACTIYWNNTWQGASEGLLLDVVHSFRCQSASSGSAHAGSAETIAGIHTWVLHYASHRTSSVAGIRSFVHSGDSTVSLFTLLLPLPSRVTHSRRCIAIASAVYFARPRVCYSHLDRTHHRARCLIKTGTVAVLTESCNLHPKGGASPVW